jgi:hypothetical protein
VDAPEHLLSSLTAHHTFWNEPHIIQELDANIRVTEQERNKQLICNTIGAQNRTPKFGDETYSCSLMRRWYVLIIDVTSVSVSVVLR